MSKTKFKSIDDYISTFPKNVQEILEKIRQTIKEAAPGAEEFISYQIPAFKLNGKYLIYFAGWKNHIGVYPISTGMESSIKELSEYYTSKKGTAQFSLNKQMPLPLIKKIVKLRTKENLEREKIKKKTA